MKKDILDQNRVRWAIGIIALVSSFIGAGIGICIGIWFKLPDHTIDVFSFTESAFGVVLTVIALIITLGVIRQRAEIESLLVTKREEIMKVLTAALETGAFAAYKKDLDEKYAQLYREIGMLRRNQDQLKKALDVSSPYTKDIKVKSTLYDT